MNLQLVHGDLFHSQAEAWVNPTNALGISGAGLALAFRQRFRQMADEYLSFCVDYRKQYRHVPIGVCWAYHQVDPQHPKALICLPTKRHPRDPSQLADIAAGLGDLVHLLEMCQIPTVALPALGCGKGKLNFEQVLPLIKNAFTGHSFDRVEVYPPPIGRYFTNC